MESPRVPQTAFTERAGVYAVAAEVNSAGCIWRETPLLDVGIDGQIEHVTQDGVVTGRLVLVQVKSGASYFAAADNSSVPLSVSRRHRAYWENAPLPVILVLHDPESGETIWEDARHQLRVRGGSTVRVPRHQTFDCSGVKLALASAGPLPESAEDPAVVVAEMLATSSENATFPLSFFDLFVNGLTDLCHSLYFGMDLVMEVGGLILAARESELGLGIGHAEYEFLDRYVAFVVAKDLARLNYDWYREMNDRFQMVAHVHGPLTRRGREVVDHIAEVDRSRSMERRPFEQVIQERFIEMLFEPLGAAVRTNWIEDFKAWLEPDVAGRLVKPIPVRYVKDGLDRYRAGDRDLDAITQGWPDHASQFLRDLVERLDDTPGDVNGKASLE